MREAAARALFWDEPVAAEKALLRTASDQSSDVVVAAANTLKYYKSRRALRALADLRDTEDEQVRAVAVENFDSLHASFECAAWEGDPHEVALLREWMEPVGDLVCWPEEIEPRRVGPPRVSPPGVAVPRRSCWL